MHKVFVGWRRNKHKGDCTCKLLVVRVGNSICVPLAWTLKWPTRWSVAVISICKHVRTSLMILKIVTHKLKGVHRIVHFHSNHPYKAVYLLVRVNEKLLFNYNILHRITGQPIEVPGTKLILGSRRSKNKCQQLLSKPIELMFCCDICSSWATP